MGKFIAEKTVKLMAQSGSPINGAKVNVLGLTFKENCPDLRNSRVPDIVYELQSYGIEVFVHDPVAAAAEALKEYDLGLHAWDSLPRADAVIVAVGHDSFRTAGAGRIMEKLAARGVVVDVKAVFDSAAFGATQVWRL
jgi:UDP-N-acetyl-D-galactosamine dehydrogenase